MISWEKPIVGIRLIDYDETFINTTSDCQNYKHNFTDKTVVKLHTLTVHSNLTFMQIYTTCFTVTMIQVNNFAFCSMRLVQSHIFSMSVWLCYNVVRQFAVLVSINQLCWYINISYKGLKKRKQNKQLRYKNYSKRKLFYNSLTTCFTERNSNPMNLKVTAPLIGADSDPCVNLIITDLIHY